MGSKTIDLEIAVLHKTIKTPQQYFHTESLLAAIAKPLPAPRTPGGGGTGGLAGSPNPPGRKGEDRKQLWGAPSSSSGRRGRERSPRGPQGERWERTLGARRCGGLGAPGRRAGPSSNHPLPCGSSVPGEGQQGGRVAGTQRRRNDWAREAGAAFRAWPLRTIDPGGRAAAPARECRVGTVPCPGALRSERCLGARGSLLSPLGS